MRSVLQIVLLAWCGASASASPPPPGVGLSLVPGSLRCIVNASSPGSLNNSYGYEDGSVRLVGGALHMLVSEEWAAPQWVGMRLAHWSSASADGTAPWLRVGTLVLDGREMVSSRNCSADHTAALWSPVAFFEEAAGTWFISYVGYMCPNADGVVRLAQSTVAGPDGIGGPFVSAGTLLARNSSAQPWEGAQGDDSFFPFHAPGGALPPLFALFGSSDGASYWSVGLAASASGSIRGPWARAAAGNPLAVNGQRMENPIVLAVVPPNASSPLLIAVYDDIAGEAEGFGLTWSLDGVAWAAGQVVAVDGGGARAPMGLLDMGDGTVLVIFNRKSAYDSLWTARFAIGPAAPFSPPDHTPLTTRACGSGAAADAQRFFARADGTLRLAANDSICVDLFGCDTSVGAMDVWTCHIPGDKSVCGGSFPSDPPVNQLFDLARSDGTVRYLHDERYCLTAAANPEALVSLQSCAAGNGLQQWALVADGAGDGAVLVQHLGAAGCLSVG